MRPLQCCRFQGHLLNTSQSFELLLAGSELGNVGNRVYSHKDDEIMSGINGVDKYCSDTFRCHDVMMFFYIIKSLDLKAVKA